MRRTRFLRPQLDGMTRRVVLSYLAVDLVFEAEVGLGFLYVVGHHTTAERVRILLGIAIVGASLLTPFLVSLAVLLRPVERWIADDRAGRATRAQTEHVGRVLRRIPMQFTILQLVKWPATYALVGLINGGAPSQAALWLFVVTFFFGPPPIGHSMAHMLTAPAMSRYSLAAHAAGIPDVARPRALHTQLIAYGVCLCMAPACYMSSVVVLVRSEPVTDTGLAMLIGCFLVSVIVFAAVCAGLVSDTITTPIRAISSVVQGIADQGYVGDAPRIAMLRRDEIGELVALTNDMMATLAGTERGRREASRALSDLAHTLELRVAERTSSLVTVNAALAARTTSLVAVNAALAAEMQARAQMECELRQAQKLESVGRLAAGIAHEINTPLQFVSDSVEFASDCFASFADLLAGYTELRQAVLAGAPAAAELATAMITREEAADVPYLVEQLPDALRLAFDGVQRVGGIVRSVKQFAYQGRVEMAFADINLAVQSTVTVSAREYKEVADLITELDDLPPVMCHVGEINQVVLNLIVNAAHAIDDVVRGTPVRGRIMIRTSVDGDCVVIAVADTGAGIPEVIRPYIFDAFFTTKEVGRGTGQGLAIARSVVDKHGGRLTFDTVIDAGTTFYIRLPIAGPPAAKPARAPAEPLAAPAA